MSPPPRASSRAHRATPQAVWYSRWGGMRAQGRASSSSALWTRWAPSPTRVWGRPEVRTSSASSSSPMARSGVRRVSAPFSARNRAQ